ncbi:M20 metallopeptidase family protein [Thalassobacillus devorans]|uniref:M20 metallopeptidase family protein n=1 Tax=Thalassobacillus devorans TaxID=279813 RepID=UPI0004921BCA|nr:amidohydrolase [Thalassobacillus devorans]
MNKNTNKKELINDVINDVVEWRRHLHQYPELSFEEVNTSQFVFDKLQSFGGMEIERPTRTSVVARLKGKHPGKVLALRADMDALPIQEETETSFPSTKPGVMHACGHDGHTAMLLGAAKILSSKKDELSGEIIFIFQHAEELRPGGAKELTEKGVVDDADHIVGLHLMSTLQQGKFGITSGPVTSNTDEFDLKLIGKGGHSSQPEHSIDPIAISAQIITNLQHIVSRNVAPADKLVISTTMIHGGTASNVIPDSVKLTGSVRSFSPEVRNKAVHLIEQIIDGVARAHGARYEYDYHYGYSSVVNDEQIIGWVEETISREFGDDYIEYSEPFMGGEDFSAYLDKAPGAFVIVGARNEAQGFDYPHHHPKFGIDERSLEDGLRLLVHLSDTILKK